MIVRIIEHINKLKAAFTMPSKFVQFAAPFEATTAERKEAQARGASETQETFLLAANENVNIQDDICLYCSESCCYF
jgi:hypothetical protein